MIIRGSKTEVYHLLKMIDENEYVFISRMFGDGKTIYFFGCIHILLSCLTFSMNSMYKTYTNKIYLNF